VAFGQTFAGSGCSRWTSGISPGRCFSQEQIAITAAALRTDTVFATETRILRATVTVLARDLQAESSRDISYLLESRAKGESASQRD
jgi:hypothetical protein